MERRYNPRRLRGVVDDEYYESATFLPWRSLGTSRRAKVGIRTGKQRRQLVQPEFKSWGQLSYSFPFCFFPLTSRFLSFPFLFISLISYPACYCPFPSQVPSAKYNYKVSGAHVSSLSGYGQSRDAKRASLQFRTQLRHLPQRNWTQH